MLVWRSHWRLAAKIQAQRVTPDRRDQQARRGHKVSKAFQGLRGRPAHKDRKGRRARQEQRERKAKPGWVRSCDRCRRTAPLVVRLTKF